LVEILAEKRFSDVSIFKSPHKLFLGSLEHRFHCLNMIKDLSFMLAHIYQEENYRAGKLVDMLFACMILLGVMGIPFFY